MSQLTEWFTTASEDLGYSPMSVLVNMVLALLAGLLIAVIYRRTHKGLSYSQSFVVTLVLMCITVSAVMMVIGSNLARAFALVGALTIVRFRTVVKDTRDTAFIFFALTEGIASGTGNYVLTFFSTLFIGTVALLLFRTNFGSMHRSEFMLRFRFNRETGDEQEYISFINERASKSTIIHIEPSSDGVFLTLTYDLSLKPGFSSSDIVTGLNAVQGIDNVNMVTASNDIDF
ncbi:MAG: hypothetical protein AVO35_01200 [Candidatus Aegiribacteria sp. MLS_C]|nr:MAG: hypothetical protein AVO35_01200 [Candidatus Aegiribacteria sp. MLS_C]